MRKFKLFGLSLTASLFLYIWGVAGVQSIHNSVLQPKYDLPAYISKFKAAINPKFIFPLTVNAPITSSFGNRIHPITGKSSFHYGVDLGAETGTPVLAALTGVAVWTAEKGGYGLTVQLEHDSKLRTLYAHLSRIAVQQGQSVSQGKIVGYVGSTGNSTGPHLHFEVRRQTGNGWEPVNPAAEIGDIQIAQVNLRPVVEDIPPCDKALWGKCVDSPAPRATLVLPSCRVALFGNCNPNKHSK